MKKVFLLFCLINIFPVFAQLRDNVCIVRNVTSEEEKQEWDSLLKTIFGRNSKSDYDNDAGFGSGFVYKHTDGKKYVITNNHVVPSAYKATAEFDEKGTKYNMTVIATDPYTDLAVLSFDDDVPVCDGLKFYSGELEDGDDVWTAGFPGLDNKPSWQLGFGKISNAKLKDFLDTDVTYFIQHTAQVDPGSSGGPLLVKQGKNYFVAGINTWKVSDRQDVNVSIPSDYIQKVIKEKFENKIQPVQEIKVLTEKIVSSSDHLYCANFISNSLALNNGAYSIYYSNDYEYLQKVLSSLGFLGMMKVSIVLDFQNSFGNQKNPVVSEPERIEDNYYMVKIENRLVLYWKLENGNWKVDDASIYRTQKRNKFYSRKIGENNNHAAKTKSQMVRPIEISAGYARYWGDNVDMNDYFLQAAWRVRSYLSLNFSAELPNYNFCYCYADEEFGYDFKTGDYDYNYSYYTTDYDLWGFGFNFGFSALVPIHISKYDLTLSATPQLGTIKGDHFGSLVFTFDTGLEFTVPVSKVGLSAFSDFTLKKSFAGADSSFACGIKSGLKVSF